MWYGWPAMLDLKAKLAAAGLVTPAEVAAAERKGGPRKPAAGPRGQEPGRDDRPGRDARPAPADQADSGKTDPRKTAAGPRDQSARDQSGRDRPGKPHQPRPPAKPAAPRSGLDAATLLKAGKGAAYDAIRRAVDRARLDALLAIPGEQAEAFHFTTAAGQLSRLMLEPAVRTALADGTAGIVAFMSHHGLAHCVVPRPLADDIFRIFPLWLRVLKDHPGAGQQEPPREPRPATDPKPATDNPATDGPAADPAP